MNAPSISPACLASRRFEVTNVEFRDAASNYVANDPLLSQVITTFQFEKLPATDQRADDTLHDRLFC